MADKVQSKKIESKTSEKKKGLPTIAIVGIGCFVILALIGIGIAIAGKLLFSKIGLGLVKKGIEDKTGISISTDKGKEGMTYTDPETGAKIEINADATIPDGFPKDFPLYPGAKPSGSMSGGKSGEGFWIMLTTLDSTKAIEAFYTKQLPAKGWIIGDTMNFGDVSTIQSKKGMANGVVTIASDKDKKETTIMIAITTEDNTGSNTPLSVDSTENPMDEPLMDEPVGNQ